MTNPVELANELSGELKKIHYLQVFNLDNTKPIITAVDLLPSGKNEVQNVTILCETTAGNVFPQFYVSMLSDYASGDHHNCKLIMNLVKKTPESKNYLIDSILLKD